MKRHITTGEAEGLAQRLEQLAELVRRIPPWTVELELTNRALELPPEDGWRVVENGGPGAVRMELHWLGGTPGELCP